MRALLTAYPNIDRWLGRLVERLGRFPEDEYVVLRDELTHAATEAQYRRDLQLLDDHLELAAKICSRFDRLMKERSGLGADLQQANRMLLDKLAEIRAIVGLHHLRFRGIAYEGTPDLSATGDSTTFAVEVTRLAASPGQTVPLLAMLWTGDGSEQELADELFSKIVAKYRQLSKASSKDGKYVIWISLGRDYFTAGRYERTLTGLRSRMSGYVSNALNRAVAKVQRQMRCQEPAYVVVCPGREEKEIVAAVGRTMTETHPSGGASGRSNGVGSGSPEGLAPLAGGMGDVPP